MSTQTANTADTWTRALARAVAARLVAYRLDGATYEVPSASTPGQCHRVTRVGPRPADWHCDCPAGALGRICQHAAVVAFAAKHGVHAVRPAEHPAVTAATRILADAAEAESFCHCDCGARYAYTDGTLLERLYCPDCRADHPALAGYR
jgi:hypothetical protein